MISKSSRDLVSDLFKTLHSQSISSIQYTYCFIGEGAYSSVYHARRIADNEYYALKKVRMMKLSDKEKENALNEVRILASITHPNIVAYKEAFIDEPSSSLVYLQILALR
jgi:NIMA (never in mitosis gene a)-related kinase